MKLRTALTAVCAVALVLGAAPATAADDAADLTLVVATTGASQTWSAPGVPLGPGAELVGDAAGTCEASAVVDVDPAARTVTVTVPRAETSADVTLTIESGAIGGLAVVTAGLSGVTLTATPEIAIITFQVAAAAGAECATATAVFSYVAPGEPVPVVVPPLAPASPGAPAAGQTPDATPAVVVVADPTFAG